MNPSFEILAVLAGANAAPAIAGLQFWQADGYILAASDTPRQTLTLPQSRKAILRDAFVKQQLLEACMGFGTVLVMRQRFFLSRDQFPSFLAANALFFDRQAKRFKDHVQYQITVSWDAQHVLARFRNAPEIAPLFEAGHTTQDALNAGVSALGARLCNEFQQDLAIAAADLVTLPLAQDVILNAAVLIHSNAVSTMEQAVARIDAVWTEGLQIKQIGPAPAASFGLLDPHDVTPEQINAALMQFGLDALPSVEQLPNLRRNALQNNPQNAQAIKQAATTLDAACRLGSTKHVFALCDLLAEDKASRILSHEVA